MCTDGAAVMAGNVKGLLGHIKKVNLDIKWMHCIIHPEALAGKRTSPELSAVMYDAVKVINFIQSRPLNHRLFQSLCHEWHGARTAVASHRLPLAVSRGNTTETYELCSEVCVFFDGASASSCCGV